MSEILKLLNPILARKLTRLQRLELADELQMLVDRQRAIADADSRIGHVVRASATDGRKKMGRPLGSGARFVRWESRRDGRTGQLYIGRALWQELDSPPRVDIQRLGGKLMISPCGPTVGWACIKPSRGMPHCSIGDESAAILGLLEGRHPAEIRAGAIWV